MRRTIEIFRTGRHTAMSGVTLEFSESDLAATVAAYDPALHRAPLVVGHPKVDSPSYGWVDALALNSAGRLSADADDIDESFAESVRTKRYPNVSASFYPPTSKHNPKPGVYYLRHVGFLGATPPAVKGLKPVEFADDGEDCVTIEFGDWADRNVARMFSTLRDWILGKFGQEAADLALPGWSVDEAIGEAAQTDAPSYAEGGTEKTVDPAGNQEAAPATGGTPPAPAGAEDEDKDKELKERELKLKEREAELAEKERESEVASHRSFCEGLVRSGRPIPCGVDLAVAFCSLLSGDDSVSFADFGEGLSPVELFKQRLLAKLPQKVNFGELGDGGDDPPDTEDAESFAEEIKAVMAEAEKQGRYIDAARAAGIVRSRKAER